MKKIAYPAVNHHDEGAQIPALGAKGWISGTGNPTPAGNPAQNGFHYLDNFNGNVWEKKAGEWALVGNIHGSVWRWGQGSPNGQTIGANATYNPPTMGVDPVGNATTPALAVIDHSYIGPYVASGTLEYLVDVTDLTGGMTGQNVEVKVSALDLQDQVMGTLTQNVIVDNGSSTQFNIPLNAGLDIDLAGLTTIRTEITNVFAAPGANDYSLAGVAQLVTGVTLTTTAVAGANTDFYLDVDSNDVYEFQEGTGWVLVDNLQGDASWAMEWADNPEDVLVSVPAGGNGVDEYSARHWATKAFRWAQQTGTIVESTDYSSKEWAIGIVVPQGSAKDWAQQTGAQVDGVEYSAKEWALGIIVPAGSAKDWATQVGSQVDGVEYSAREWAIGTAVPAGSAKDWAQEPEDSLVDGVGYSSLHHAAKSAASAAAALASENAALLALNSIPFATVDFITFADSPYTVTDTHRGHLISVDTSGGPVTINLPSIAGATLPFTMAVKKSTADGNAVTLDANGTDLIDGGATIQIIGQDSGYTIIADDTVPDPDNWGVIEFGTIRQNYTIDIFEEGVDYTGDVTTQLTLSLDPGHENNVEISFDGIVQHTDTYSLVGPVVTFDAPINAIFGFVQARIGASLPISAIAQDAVDTQNVIDDAIDNTKASDMAQNTIKGRISVGTGDPEDMTPAQVRTMLNVEAGATADQTGAEIKSAYEAEADTNAFTDAEQTKLSGIEAGATADQSDAEIKTAYENNADTNAFTDAEQTKLSGIEAGATADQSDAEIETAYNNQVAVVGQAEAEAGVATVVRRWTAQRIAQAIAALETGASVHKGARVYNSTNPTLSSGSTVTLSFDSEDFDTNNIHDNVTNNTRLTVPAGFNGYARLACAIAFSDADLTKLQDLTIVIWKNGGAQVVGRYRPSDGSAVIATALEIPIIFPVIPVAANDYFEMRVSITTSDSSQLTVASGLTFTEFSIELLD